MWAYPNSPLKEASNRMGGEKVRTYYIKSSQKVEIRVMALDETGHWIYNFASPLTHL